jgi:hypothetical protein
MLSLYNFILIIVICLITPSVLQVEERLSSQEGLWDSVDFVTAHGKKKLREIRAQAMHSLVRS